MACRPVMLSILLSLAATAFASAQASPDVSLIVPRRAVVVGGVTRAGRDALPRDAVQALIVRGPWKPPAPGDIVRLPNGEARVWEAVDADAEGLFRHPALRGGYASVMVQADQDRVMLLEAWSHSMVYVNGEPRSGNPYANDYARIPVALKSGPNELLFACGRGEFRARLRAMPAEIMLDSSDVTAPDLVRGESADQWAAVVVLNGSRSKLSDAEIAVRGASGRTVRSRLPAIPALSARKVGFRIPGARNATGSEVTVSVTLSRRSGGRAVRLDGAEMKLRLRDAGETRKCTFVSEVDGSIQYYAVVPPRQAQERIAKRPPALTLTLHGAGVEAIGQAASYAPKRGMWIVAPTNRRPFGFDWEEWGRMDALEVLSAAQTTLQTDPSRTYLTGHSMGGHGTWHIGVTFPGLFAAIAPSAGWVSFQSYAGGARYESPAPVESILKRATAASDTLALVRNLGPLGVYILHGDKDDNVPVTEARAIAAKLGEFHRNFTLFEQPGAGHWWGAPSDPGSGCVDWPAMFDLFHRSVTPPLDDTRHVEFTTVNPGVSATMRWLTILQQQRPLAPSSASIRCDPVGKRFVGTTKNVASLRLDTAPFHAGDVVSVDLDGWKRDVPVPQGGRGICLARTSDGWAVAEPPASEQKRPGRAGPFKEAFSRRFALVYGTGGTPEEQAWSFARARYDAETFWYRGNGSPDVVADTEFDPGRFRDRSIVLYGHSEMNGAWARLLAHCPVKVRRGSARIGEREYRGDDLACLFCYPRSDSANAYVAVVAGTGGAGMRLTDRAPYFVSGTGFPDLLVWTPETLASGPGGVRAAGFFGNDWSLERGDFTFSD